MIIREKRGSSGRKKSLFFISFKLISLCFTCPESTGGNKLEAAKRLGISRVGLYKKIKRYFGEDA